MKHQFISLFLYHCFSEEDRGLRGLQFPVSPCLRASVKYYIVYDMFIMQSFHYLTIGWLSNMCYYTKKHILNNI